MDFLKGTLVLDIVYDKYFTYSEDMLLFKLLMR